jgi:hypothetical protein
VLVLGLIITVSPIVLDFAEMLPLCSVDPDAKDNRFDNNQMIDSKLQEVDANNFS